MIFSELVVDKDTKLLKRTINLSSYGDLYTSFSFYIFSIWSRVCHGLAGMALISLFVFFLNWLMNFVCLLLCSLLNSTSLVNSCYIVFPNLLDIVERNQRNGAFGSFHCSIYPCSQSSFGDCSWFIPCFGPGQFIGGRCKEAFK